MTPDEKASRKAARRLRDQAYHVRYKEMRAAEAAKKAAIDAEYSPPIASASAEINKVMAERYAELEKINEQIAALENKKQVVSSSYEETLHKLREAYSEVLGRRNALYWDIRKEIETVFPDMIGYSRFNWSIAEWSKTDYAKKALGQ